jgi:signal transduction histidine kinase
MGGPIAWLLTDRILVYNEVLLGRASLERLPIGVLLWNPTGLPIYANAAARDWLGLDPNVPAWAAFWQRFTGHDAPAGERGAFQVAKPNEASASFLYVTDHVRNLEGQEVAVAAYVAPEPGLADRGGGQPLDEAGMATGDRTLAILLFREDALRAWTPLSPRWPALDSLAGEREARVLEHLSREVEGGRAPQFALAREALSDGSVLMLAQAVEEHAAAGTAFRHDQLIAATAHEIRNPLATIRGFLQILPTAGPEERERYAQIAMREVDRIIDVVNEFLQGGEFADVAASPVDLVAVARSALDTLRTETLGAGVSLALEGEERDIWVSGRATRLAQVVTNLLHNAVESIAAPGGHVWVSVTTDDGWARLVVEDDGPGVPEEWLEAVFEPAFSRRQGGHGLGLAIARWIVTSHGGRIAVGRSRTGGARFEVFLPRAPVRDPSPNPAPSTPPN